MGLRSWLHRITAPHGAGVHVRDPVKLVCVVNQSLKMGKGKIAAQVGHASVGAFLGAGPTHPGHVEAWLASGQKKICVKVPEDAAFDRLMAEAKALNVPFHLVRDAGHTQIPAGSKTVLALGPYESETLDRLTGELKLL